MLALEVADGEAADADRRRGVEAVPDVDRAAVERQRRVLQLEGAARLVHAGHRAVEPLLGRGLADEVGVVVGQAHHGDDLAGAHVHHDAAGADGVEIGHRLEQLVAHDGLHAHVDGQAQRRRVLAQALVEEPLHPGHAAAVDVDAADDLGGDPAEREAPALGGLEIDARDAERVDLQLLARGDLAGEVDEFLGLGGQPAAEHVGVEPGQHAAQLLHGRVDVEHLGRVGDDAGGGQRDGEDLAVAVGDGRAGRAHAEIGGRRGGAGRGLGRRRLGPARLGDRAGQHGVEDGGVGELHGQQAEQRGKAAGGDGEALAADGHGGEAGRVGAGGEADGLHPRHRAGGRRTEAAGEVGGRGRRLAVLRAHRWPMPCAAGATKLAAGMVRATPRPEPTAGGA